MNPKPKIHNSRTALRLPQWQREQIDKLVTEGKFKSLSQVIRAAVTEFLKHPRKEGQ
jgi:Arc/MetJ-type ribon-helix-helix transcriptional regulator